MIIRFLKRLFKSKHPLAVHAKNGNFSEFCQIFPGSKIFVLSDNLGEGLSFNAPEADVLKIAEKAAKDQSSQIKIFTFSEENLNCLPFFLTITDAEEFCGAYSGRENKIYAYQVLEVPGSAIYQYLTECDEIIMNSQCNDEFIMDEQIVSTLKSQEINNDWESEIYSRQVILPLPKNF